MGCYRQRFSSWKPENPSSGHYHPHSTIQSPMFNPLDSEFTFFPFKSCSATRLWTKSSLQSNQSNSLLVKFLGKFQMEKMKGLTAHQDNMKIPLNQKYLISNHRKKHYLNLSKVPPKCSCHWPSPPSHAGGVSCLWEVWHLASGSDGNTQLPITIKMTDWAFHISL